MPENRLLKNREFLDAVEEGLRSSRSEIVLISAFLRSEVLEWVSQNVPSNISLTVLSRWRMDDLLSGASDLKAYEIAKKRGWDFYIDNDLHAKALLIDKDRLFLGSANFTSKGTHLFHGGNNELNIAVNASEGEIGKISSFFHISHKLLWPMYQYMCECIDEAKMLQSDEGLDKREWPSEITECISPNIKHLWVDECLHLTPKEYFDPSVSPDKKMHDYNILCSWEDDKRHFLHSRLARWLRNLVENTNHELKFGEVTAKLHNSFINDPKPYRRDVKEYVSVLFEWIKHYHLYSLETYSRTTVIVKEP